MIEQKVEKDWITEAGLRAVVLMSKMGHRCGYVGIGPNHPLYGASYAAKVELLFRPDGSPEGMFTVHGGVTYSGAAGQYPVETDADLWWFGFDCGHWGDKPCDEFIQSLPPGIASLTGNGVHRTLEYVVAECELLARQLIEGPIEYDD